MKFEQLRNELVKASDILLEAPQYEIDGSLDAVDICSGFENSARRVPRNICADPSVEAKNAVSKIFRIGVRALGQSMKNCVREADDAYLLDYVRAIESLFRDYLAIDLTSGLNVSSDGRRLSFEIALDENRRLTMCASGAFRGDSSLVAEFEQEGVKAILNQEELSKSFLKD